MNRRGAFSALALGAASLVGSVRAQAGEARATKVVYHLADAEKAVFVLGALRHHLDGDGPIALAVVVHGPALQAFRRDRPDPGVRTATREAVARGVAFHACAYTMAGMKLTLADLEPGFSVAEKAAFVLLADLQAQGWVYLRP